MCHIGNVDTHLHVSVWQSRQRESIVEVLCIARVDGESNCIAHILSLGHLFGGDSGIDFIGSFHHIFRISVRQAKFGKDCMYFGIVVSGFAEDVDHLTDWRIAFLVPFDNAHNSLVAALSAFKLVFWDEDICGKELAVGEQGGKVLVDLQSTDKHLVLLLDNLNHLGLRLVATALGADVHLHLVAV